MPYQPAVRGAEALPVDAIKTALTEENIYRLGGNSCFCLLYTSQRQPPSKAMRAES